MGDRRKCQTCAASPAEPGGLPVVLGQSFAQKRMHDEAIAGVSESDRDFRTRWGLRHESRLRFCRFGKKDLEFRQDQNPSAEANIGLTYVGFDDQDQTMIRIEQGL